MKQRLMLFALAFVGSLPLSAMTLSRAALNDELAHATLVADIEVEQIRSVPDKTLFARLISTARVEKIISVQPDGGSFPIEGQRIMILTPGGELEGKGVFYSGLARPYVNHRYKAYLRRAKENYFQVTGLEFGLQGPRSRGYSRNRTDGSDGEGNGPFLYWDQSYFPLPYFISAPSFQGHPDFVAAIDASFQTWRNVDDIKVEFSPMGCSNKTLNQNDGVNSVIFVNNAWPYDSAAIAITRNYYLAGNSPRAGQMLSTDILLNGADHEFTTSGEAGKYDVQDIVTHEAGHFLGMGHEVDPIDTDATMYAIADPDETIKRTLHTDDLAGIRSAYGGVGNKIGPQTSQCPIASAGASGCLAVHARPTDFIGGTCSLLGGIVFIVFLFALGRQVTR